MGCFNVDLTWGRFHVDYGSLGGLRVVLLPTASASFIKTAREPMDDPVSSSTETPLPEGKIHREDVSFFRETHGLE